MPVCVFGQVAGDACVLVKKTYDFDLLSLNPDFAVGVVARHRKPQRNAQLERFCDEGILINMLRSKIVKQALQQGFSSRSRWLLQILEYLKIIWFRGYG